MNEPPLDPPDDRSDEFLSDCCDASADGALHFPNRRQQREAYEHDIDCDVTGRCSACKMRATFHKE